MIAMKKRVLLIALLTSGLLPCAARAITPAEEPTVKVVQKTLPSVVNIHTERLVQRLVSTQADAFMRRYWIATEPVYSLGSGLLVSPDGYIVTNHHVVEMAEELKIRVSFYNGSNYEAKFITSDPDKDLALLKIEDPKELPAFDLKTLSPNLLGQTVIAVGNPVGYENSVSQGILSATNRRLKTESGEMTGLLQTDAAINPGNSGGPLVDINGNLVGINTAKFSGQSVEGIGFSIPATTVVEWITDAIAVAKGQKAPPETAPLDILKKRFGFSLKDLTREFILTTGYRVSGGMYINEVEPGSPADKAGLTSGMVILGFSIDGRTIEPIYNQQSLPRSIQRIKSGQKVKFTVVTILTNGVYRQQRGGQISIEAR
jgi:serine protease Do